MEHLPRNLYNTVVLLYHIILVLTTTGECTRYVYPALRRFREASPHRDYPALRCRGFEWMLRFISYLESPSLNASWWRAFLDTRWMVWRGVRLGTNRSKGWRSYWERCTSNLSIQGG